MDQIVTWIKINWDAICDLIEKMFATIAEMVG